jgi:CRP/FNR family transcriptional regulator
MFDSGAARPRGLSHAIHATPGATPSATTAVSGAGTRSSQRDASFQAAAEDHGAGACVRLRAGSVLFSEGQESTNVAVLCAGRVKLTTSSRDGRTMLVRIARSGDLLGLSAVMSRTPYEVTAQAIDDSLVLCYEQRMFLHFIQNNAEGSLYAAECLAEEYRSAFCDVRRLALSNSIPGRMANLLLEMMEDGGHAMHSQPVIDMPLTHEDLAAMLGSSRETVTRTLNHMKRSGTLAIAGRKVTILQRATLEAMV